METVGAVLMIGHFVVSTQCFTSDQFKKMMERQQGVQPGGKPVE
jgi:hypothetical protein